MASIPAIVGLLFVAALAVVTIVLCYFAFVVSPRQSPEGAETPELG